jgi:hypothetical protein
LLLNGSGQGVDILELIGEHQLGPIFPPHRDVMGGVADCPNRSARDRNDPSYEERRFLVMIRHPPPDLLDLVPTANQASDAVAVGEPTGMHDNLDVPQTIRLPP